MATRAATYALALACFLLLAGSALAAETEPRIVVYRAGLADPGAQTRDQQRDLGFKARFRFRHAVKGFSARLTDRQADRLRADPDVAFVEPDRPVKAFADAVPPGLLRTSAATPGATRPASGVAVAVIDTGIDLANPDLNVAAGANCSDTGPPVDENGHGTHVAGTIAARADGTGVVGVAPGTQLYSVKALDENGRGETSQIICAIDWVTANAADLGIRVVNMSLGETGPTGTCASNALHAAICASAGAGVTYVVAAGNDGHSFTGSSQVPASFPEVLTVTAMADSDGAPGGAGADADCDGGGDDAAASFSNFAVGAAAVAHTIAAPGVCVLSLAPGGGVRTMSGTSMASPHVAGTVALCLDEGGVDGPCAGLPPAGVIGEVRAAAASHATAANGFAGDPFTSVNPYYGYLLWAGRWPIATTGVASALGDHAATVAGSVDPRGLNADWRFEYGPTTGYGSETAAGAVAPGAPAGVSSPLTGLLPGTTYHYRLVASADDGFDYHGADATFQTTGEPPPPPPDTLIDSGPPAATVSGQATFWFSSTGTPATGFECRLDAGAWATCTSPLAYDSLTDDTHIFEVRALGAGGTVDASAASFTWSVDGMAPQTSIAGAPAAVTTNRSAVFGFTSSEPESTFTCRLDGGPWAPCTAPRSYQGLAPGQHVFEVYATDAAANADGTPASRSWLIQGPPEPPPADPPAADPAVTEQPPAGDAGAFGPLAPPQPLTTPVVQPAAAAVSGAGRPLLRTGRTLELRLRCAAGAACRGIVELTYTPRGGRTVVLGRFNVSIAAGGSRVAKAPLLRAGGALLRRTKRPVLRLAARSPLRLAKPFRARLSTK